MTNNKDHLDIDLNFLDKKDTPITNSAQSNGANPSTHPIMSSKKYNWKNILIVGGIILFVGWLIVLGSSDNSSSPTYSSASTNYGTSNTNNSGSQTVSNDGYMCSQYDSDEANSLDPDLNNVTLNQLKSDQAVLNQESTDLDQDKSKLDAEYVDENDQSAIDQYNLEVDNYNAKLQQYKTASQDLNKRIDTYNAGEIPHNNYLAQHCTKD